MDSINTSHPEGTQSGRKPNRLIREKSPYLLQHAYNPVDWYPWGEEAIRKARAENKPIFLSVGYSTCYWCHVMEREVFEDTSIAGLMNQKLVCIKVDREERPDIDRLYMTAVQAMTGSGGWPMSVFLTPDLKPFFAGTYIPPAPRYGRPGFPDIVKRISELWEQDRSKLVTTGEEIARLLQDTSRAAPGALTDSVMAEAYRRYRDAFDPIHGGFGGAPKFPRPASLNFLLRYSARTGGDSAREMVFTTLREMAKGGIHDHLGGGFHRYSVDELWHVPHFEKMLYDQAQLASSYLEAYQLSRDSSFADVARDIEDYVLRAMQNPAGGFYSAEDAESAIDPARPEEREEGAFYVWKKKEVEALLTPEEAALACRHYGIEDSGNTQHDSLGTFAGKNVLFTPHSAEDVATQFHTTPDAIRTVLGSVRSKLFAAREKRPHPRMDDKIITAWNGLMISALARGSRILGEPGYLTAAKRAAAFVMSNLYDDRTGTLHRRFRDGEARFDGGLQDYAFLTMGLIDLYESSFEVRWLKDAIALTSKSLELFHDPVHGGFYDSPPGDSTLLFRTKEEYDGAEPAGNSVLALNLLRLAQFTGKTEWGDAADQLLAAFRPQLTRTPDALPQMLVALDWKLSSPGEIVIAGKPASEDTELLLEEVWSRFLPHHILLLADGAGGVQTIDSLLPVVGGMRMIGQKATAYVCQNFSCQLPTTNPAEVGRMLDETLKKRN